MQIFPQLSVALLLLVGLSATAQAAPTYITNAAQLSWQTQPGGAQARVQQSSVVVSLMLQTLPPSNSSMETFAYRAGASPRSIAPVTYSNDGGVSWQPVPAPSIGGTALDLNQPQPLAPATGSYTGAPVFVCVSDADQNQDTTAADSVPVTVTAGTQTLHLALTETGVNTGRFCGYYLTTNNPTQTNGYTLVLAPGDTATVHYVDRSNPADTATQALTVPSWNRLVNGSDGSLMDGIQLTLTDTTTGQPVQVLGQDGVSAFPATVTTGQDVADASGFSYDMQSGNFVFPYVPAGSYRIKVDNLPAGYRLADASEQSALQALAGAPFNLSAASYGQVFTLTSAQPLSFDMALMPTATGLYVTVQGDSNQLAIGDLTQFTVTAENTSSSGPANQVQLVDTLPPGFRFEPGSLRINGQPAADPIISADGQRLSVTLGTLAAGAKATITYVARVTPITHKGRVTNLAQASAQSGLTSNLASYALTIREDLMQSVNTLIGQVHLGCTPDDVIASQRPDNLAGMRVLLENGRYAITDEQGRFHFSELTNGTHVVQLDKATLPAGFEMATCEANSRHAGRNFSQFVELHGGALWRTDFYLRTLPAPVGSLGVQLAQRSQPGARGVQVVTKLSLNVDTIAVQQLATMVTLAPGLNYQPGSSQLNGTPIDDPQLIGNVLVYRLGDRAAGWQGQLTFAATPSLPAPKDGWYISSAFARFSTQASSGAHSGNATVALPVKVEWQGNERHYDVRYGSGGYEFKPLKDKEWARLIEDLKDARYINLTVAGNTDSIPVRAGARFKDNQELSEWRAKSLVDYLTQHGMQPDKVTIVGNGASQPVASNATAQGRAKNRRVDVSLSFDNPDAAVTEGDIESPQVTVATQGKPGETAVKVPEPPVTDAQALADAQRFTLDESWLNEANAKPELVWPKADAAPATPAIQVAIKHAAGDKVELAVNGVAVSNRNFLKQSVSSNGKVVLDQWLGVGLNEGDNTLTAVVLRDGKPVAELTRAVHFSGIPVRAEIIKDKSWLVADGQHRPFVAVKFIDRWGKQVRAGMTGSWQVSAPYQPWQSKEDLQRQQVIASGTTKPAWTVSADGLAYLVLAPTSASGKVTLTLPLQKGDEQLSVWLAPQQRDWVLVGLANGTAAFNDIHEHVNSSGHNPDDDLWQDKRVAFYAKGTVKGKYLITAAYDTAKDKGIDPDTLEQAIDPNRYYMLYADASAGGYDASSSKKLYVKIERGQFYALFGDFNAGLTVTDLSRYERRFTGVKSSYDGKYGGYTAFAAENSQAGVHDELQGNGTSGLYQLSHGNIILNSDSLRLVTRDRYTNAVLSTQTLSRFLDYNLDPVSGSLFFKQPVANRDEHFNPVYIVADYEVQSAGKDAVTAGGRAYAKLAGGDLEVGASAIQEGSPAGNNHLIGIDLKGKLTDTLTLKGEAAHTVSGTPGTSTALNNGSSSGATVSDVAGDAYEISLEQQAEKLRGKLYYKKVGDGFGLGQQSLSDVGVERYGWDGQYNFTRVWSLTSRMDSQHGLSANSMLLEAGGLYQQGGRSVNFGARHTQSDDMQVVAGSGANSAGRSDQVYVGGSMDLTRKLSANAQTSQNVSGDVDSANPPTTQLGLGYALTNKTRLFANQTFAANAVAGYSRMTEVGLDTRPAAGTQVNTSMTRQQTEAGARLFSTTGLTQGWKVNERWNLSAGMSRSQTIRAATPTVNAALPASSADTQDFTSAYLGSGYQGDVWQLTNRLEYLTSKTQQRYGLFGGAYRELGAGTGMASSLQLLTSDFATGGSALNLALRFGFAHRPMDSAWAFLDQLDFLYNDQSGGGTAFNSPLAGSQQSPATGGVSTSSANGNLNNWRLVNNFNVNYKRDDARWQLSGYYGAKYARFSFVSGNYDSYTDLVGAETRFDITPHWDIGAHANRLTNYQAGVHKDGYGIETGYDVATNLWLSVGYNFKGFFDEDFTAAHYTAQGVYLRFRFKFDQDTLKALAKGWR